MAAYNPSLKLPPPTPKRGLNGRRKGAASRAQKCRVRTAPCLVQGASYAPHKSTGGTPVPPIIKNFSDQLQGTPGRTGAPAGGSGLAVVRGRFLAAILFIYIF